jgi:hypothetical protein
MLLNLEVGDVVEWVQAVLNFVPKGRKEATCGVRHEVPVMNIT